MLSTNLSNLASIFWELKTLSSHITQFIQTFQSIKTLKGKKKKNIHVKYEIKISIGYIPCELWNSIQGWSTHIFSKSQAMWFICMHAESWYYVIIYVIMGISIYLHEHAINQIIKNQILVISSLHVNHIIHFKSCKHANHSNHHILILNP